MILLRTCHKVVIAVQQIPRAEARPSSYRVTDPTPPRTMVPSVPCTYGWLDRIVTGPSNPEGISASGRLRRGNSDPCAAVLRRQLAVADEPIGPGVHHLDLDRILPLSCQAADADPPRCGPYATSNFPFTLTSAITATLPQIEIQRLPRHSRHGRTTRVAYVALPEK